MKRGRRAKTSIVPLVVLQAACAGIASVTPACGETERSGGGTPGSGNSITTGITTGVGGTVIVLAVSGFGGPSVNGTGGVPSTSTALSNTTSATSTSSSTAVTTGLPIGAGGSVIALAIAGFGGQLGEGGEAGALGEGGHAGARDRKLDEKASDAPGSR